MRRQILSVLVVLFSIFISGNQMILAGETSSSYASLGKGGVEVDLNYQGEDKQQISLPVLDQFQEEQNYGYTMSDYPFRWQEFIPTLHTLAGVDVYIYKEGSPGDLIVEVRNETGSTIIEQQTVPEASVPVLDWVGVDFDDPTLIPGEIYRIYVYASSEQTPFDRYSWRGFKDSNYCQECETDVTSSEPGYDYAFRTWGFGAWRIANADFDGCGETELSVFKVEPWGGTWYIKDQASYGYGNADSIPVPGDYNADRHVDIAVYNDGTWYVKDQFVDTWGDASSVPVPGNYDGDRDTDLAVFKVESWGGMWYIKDQAAVGYGNSESIPVPGDYDGDGTTDVAVYNDGTWYVKDQFVDTWGDADSIPVPGDYDGDGTTDLAVFKVEAWGGMWYIKDQSAHGYGNSESIPVPGDYDRNGTTDVAVYNDGTWYIKDQFVDNWGDASSYPLPAPDTNGDGDPWD